MRRGGASCSARGADGVAKVVEGFAEWGAPLLIPAGLAAVASAVGAPSFDAVRAGPGGVFDDFGLPFGREFFEEFAVVGESGLLALFDPVHGVGESHLAVFVMMAVALAVGGDVGYLGRFGVVGRSWIEDGEETLAEVFAAVEKAFEGDGARARAVVEEDGDGAAFVEADEVGVGRVDGGVGSFGPGGWGIRSCGTRSCGGENADSSALGRSEDREFDSLLGHEIEDAAVDGGFGEPHAFGFSAEAGFEVGDAPANLSDGVAAAGEGHDDVVVNLSHGGAVSAVALGADFVGVEDHAIGARGFVVQPAKEGGSEVIAHPGVVVHDADDLVFFVGDARRSVGCVALGCDAVVPVVVGGGGVLDLDGFEPGVFARGLVEVAMDADEAGSFGGCLRLGFCSARFDHNRLQLEGIAG